MKSLVIVESGAKAKKIKGYLDSNFPEKDWQVEACVGHVRDLSDKENAVDPEDWNNLKWEFSSKEIKRHYDLIKMLLAEPEKYRDVLSAKKEITYMTVELKTLGRKYYLMYESQMACIIIFNF